MSVMLNGREIATREQWLCACSGACGGAWSVRCAVKGGEYATVVVDAVTGVEVAEEVGREVARLVADWGWTDLGDGFARRPGVAA